MLLSQFVNSSDGFWFWERSERRLLIKYAIAINPPTRIRIIPRLSWGMCEPHFTMGWLTMVERRVFMVKIKNKFLRKLISSIGNKRPPSKKLVRLKRERQKVFEEIKKQRRNYLPLVILCLISWLGIFGLVYFVDPVAFGAIPVFFILVFLAILLTLLIVVGNKMKSVVVALGLTLFLVLRYFGLGNLLNFFLIIGVVGSIIVYVDTHG